MSCSEDVDKVPQPDARTTKRQRGVSKRGAVAVAEAKPAKQQGDEARAGRRRRAPTSYREPDSDEDFENASEDDSESDEEAPAKRRRRAAAPPAGPRGRKAATGKRAARFADSDSSDDEVCASDGASDEEEEDDEADERCGVCYDGGELLLCDEPGCTNAYHLGCLTPPLHAVPKGKWLCPACQHPLAEVQCILDSRPSAENKPGSPRSRLEFYVKFKDKSYRECAWVPKADLLAAGRRFPGLLTRLRNFQARGRERERDADTGAGAEELDSDADADDTGKVHSVRPEWTVVDRIIASRAAGGGSPAAAQEYLVKWKELGYEDCTWEDENALEDFAAELQRFRERGPIDTGPSAQRSGGHCKPLPFVRLLQTPPYLMGGTLHSYQLVGVNWLLNAHAAGNHVILADEMGLGKTVQAVAHLASLHHRARAEGAPVLPHLVVAPLSTLRNWEREFALWAPHMNVVLLIGSQQGRQVIRERELFAPGGRRSDGRRVQFHVLLTSYEIALAEVSLLHSLAWDVLCVDEGHRLRTKDSRLFQALSSARVRQRTLLTGTPLQNRLEELFNLLTYLDPVKFPDAEAYRARFAALDSETHLRELHALLAPHLLRRMKRDVLRDLPPKREVIVRVGLSPLQRELYKAVLTKNLPALRALTGKSAQGLNILMDLRQICCHPYLKGAEPEQVLSADEEHVRLTEASGKLVLLARLLPALHARGHRVLIYSQFTRVLDVLEDWLRPMRLQFERIDGGVSGMQRQARIDRFNAPGSPVFAFLLSTRAGGLGINLATADTVIIFDSDWNPHADAQAAARAHRMGQARDVLIYRLVTRASVEERLITMAKRKMILEHLVVQKMPNAAPGGSDDDSADISERRTGASLRQAQLDDILRYGATELFAEGEGADTGAAAALVWDDAAISQLLDRTAVPDGRDAEDDEPDDLLASFKVAHFELPAADGNGDAGAAADHAALSGDGEGAPAAGFWDALLAERFAEGLAAEADAMGKGKRARRPVSYAHAEPNASSSDDDSDDYRATDDDTSDDEASGKRPREAHACRSLIDPSGTVHGFSLRERAAFLKAVLRYGLGDMSLRMHEAAVRGKSADDVREYAALFLAHLAEPVSEGETFSDGVPKDGMRTSEVLQRIATMHLISRKLASSHATQQAMFGALPGAPRPPTITSTWGPSEDYRLLSGVMTHGFGRWRELALDETFHLQPALRAELHQVPVGHEREAGALSAPSAPAADAPKEAAPDEDAAAAVSTEKASLVQGLLPAELSAQTAWLKRRVEYLRDAIHADCFPARMHDAPQPRLPSAPTPPIAAGQPSLAGLVTVPPHASGPGRAVAEHFIALCAAVDAARQHAASAWRQRGDATDDDAYARHAHNVEQLLKQCQQLARRLGASAAGAGDDDVIILD